MKRKSSMAKLEMKIERKGFEYTILAREGNVALVKKSNLRFPDAPTSYEVWIIKRRKARTIFGKHYPAQEEIPRDSQYGQTGWTFNDFKLAEEWYRKHANLPDRSESGAIKAKKRIRT